MAKQEQQEKQERNETEEEAVKREWVYPQETIWKEWEYPYVGSWNTTKVADTPMWNMVFKVTSPLSQQFCPKWVSYFWPKVSFLSQELRRRVKALPDEVSPEQQEKVRHFTKVVGWLLCAYALEPRKGNEYGESVSRYYKKLASLPNTSFDVPMMNDDPFLVAQAKHIDAPDSCMIWSVGMICDNGWLAEKLMGNKIGSTELCWDQVEYPKYAFSPLEGLPSLDRERPPRLMDRAEHEDHAEYSACQEHPLTNEYLDEFCPMHGKYPDGFWGVDWGKAPPRNSEVYRDVLQCQKKIGLPSPIFPRTAPPGDRTAFDMGVM